MTRRRRAAYHSKADAFDADEVRQFSQIYSMPVCLPIGAARRLCFDIAPGALVAQCAAPPEGDLPARQLARQALAEPAEFPPLAAAVVPGDRVTIALAAEVPEAEGIVAEVVASLLAGNIEPAEITVLASPSAADDLPDPRRGLGDELRDKVELVWHDPHRRSELRYLAATDRDARPIYLHHRLIDADLVVPIEGVRLATRSERRAQGSGIFPAFSDADTQRRFRLARLNGHGRSLGPVPERIGREVDWLLGVQFAVEVVPGSEGRVLSVHAGAAEAVHQQARGAARRAWAHRVPRRAELVVAAIDGGPAEQSWQNLGRALETAAEAVVDGGLIAVACQLSAPPGPALERLAADDGNLKHVVRAWQRTASWDVPVASQLAAARETARIFLLSRLDEELVEQLGMAYVADEAELIRLIERSASCLLLSGAQHAALRVDEPS